MRASTWLHPIKAALEGGAALLEIHEVLFISLSGYFPASQTYQKLMFFFRQGNGNPSVVLGVNRKLHGQPHGRYKWPSTKHSTTEDGDIGETIDYQTVRFIFSVIFSIGNA